MHCQVKQIEQSAHLDKEELDKKTSVERGTFQDGFNGDQVLMVWTDKAFYMGSNK